MKEQGKSLVLGILVVLSLLLTHQLFFGFPRYEEAPAETYEPLNFDHQREYWETVQPEEIIVFSTGGNYYCFGPGQEMHQLLWKKILRLLTDSENMEFSRFEEIPAVIPDIRARFSLPFPLDPSLFHNEELSLSEISIFLSGREPKLIVEDLEGELYGVENHGLKEEWSQIGELMGRGRFHPYRLLVEMDEQERESALTFAGEFYVPEDGAYFPVVEVEPEKLNEEKLVRSFFVNYMLARRIEELDGSIIYTDGTQGVHFVEDRMEFSAPIQEKGEVNFAYPGAVDRVSDHLNLHGGWPDSLYLAEVQRDTTVAGQIKSYSFAGDIYYRGLPITRDAPAVILSLGEQGLSHYRRSVIKPKSAGKAGEIVSPETALSEVTAEYLRNRGPEDPEDPLSITEVSLIYYPVEGNDVFEPAWRIEVEGRFLGIIRAFTGETLNICLGED